MSLNKILLPMRSTCLRQKNEKMSTSSLKGPSAWTPISLSKLNLTPMVWWPGSYHKATIFLIFTYCFLGNMGL